MENPPNYFRENFLPSIKDICGLVMQAGLKKKMLGKYTQSK